MRDLRLFVIFCYLVQTLTFCGGGGGGSSSGDSLVADQNSTSSNASSQIGNAVTGLDVLNNEMQTVFVFDQTTGNRFLNFFNNQFITQIEQSTDYIDNLYDQEQELEDLVNTSNSTTSNLSISVDPNAPQLIGELIVAGVILTAIGASLLNIGLKTKARVRAVENKIDASLAQGKSQSEAMGDASGDFKQALNATVLDIQTYIATNKVSDIAKSVSSQLGQIMIDVVNSANDFINAQKVSVVGAKRKDTSSSSQLVSQATIDYSDTVYLGDSTDGQFNNIPMGTWDFIVYVNGYVRGLAPGVSVTSSFATPHVLVKMKKLNEILPSSSGSSNNGDSSSSPSGSFSVIYFQNRNGSTTGTPEISLSGSATFPTISWSFGNAASLDLVSSTGQFNYGIIKTSDENDDWFPLSSPIKYGNYSLTNTIQMPNALNPSPALNSGVNYIIHVITKDGLSATLGFNVNP